MGFKLLSMRMERVVMHQKITGGVFLKRGVLDEFLFLKEKCLFVLLDVLQGTSKWEWRDDVIIKHHKMRKKGSLVKMLCAETSKMEQTNSFFQLSPLRVQIFPHSV